MSQVDVLHVKPHDFSDDHCYRANIAGSHMYHNISHASFFADITTHHVQSLALPQSSPSFHGGSDVREVVHPATPIFDFLPPLHTGSSHHHLLEGIERANQALASNEADAERAFFVADLSIVLKQFMRWQECLPGIVPFFAVKSNPDPYVLRLLAALGAGFDCASHGEITQVLSIGTVAPSCIVFANPCKATSFIRHAAKAGVDAMTFDNADELEKISRVYPDAKLILRILTDDSKSACRLGIKFGASLQTVPRLLARARDLNLNVVGVSFHVGSGCYDPTSFNDAITSARKVFDMGKSYGYDFDLLDIGGGFEDESLERTAKVVRLALEKSFGELIEGGLKVIAEPGRFFVSSAFSLAANVIARRCGSSEESDDRVPMDEAAEAGSTDPAQVMYYINEGVYGAFNCILFDHQKVVPYALTLSRRPVEPKCKGETIAETIQTPIRHNRESSVWGPTCDSMDCVCPTVMLPRMLEVGDWLGFANMGAYTISAASQFNGFERSAVVYTAGTGALGLRVLEILRLSAGEGRVC